MNPKVKSKIIMHLEKHIEEIYVTFDFVKINWARQNLKPLLCKIHY